MSVTCCVERSEWSLRPEKRGISEVYLPVQSFLQAWKTARGLMTLCEKPQRQQHFTETDRWGGRRRDGGERNWSESSNRVRLSSSTLTYWRQTAASSRGHPGSDPSSVTSPVPNVSLTRKQIFPMKKLFLFKMLRLLSLYLTKMRESFFLGSWFSKNCWKD